MLLILILDILISILALDFFSVVIFRKMFILFIYVLYLYIYLFLYIYILFILYYDIFIFSLK